MVAMSCRAWLSSHSWVCCEQRLGGLRPYFQERERDEDQQEVDDDEDDDGERPGSRWRISR